MGAPAPRATGRAAEPQRLGTESLRSKDHDSRQSDCMSSNGEALLHTTRGRSEIVADGLAAQERGYVKDDSNKSNRLKLDNFGTKSYPQVRPQVFPHGEAPAGHKNAA